MIIHSDKHINHILIFIWLYEEDKIEIISNIGVFIGLILGCIAMFFPKKIEAFVSISTSTLEGKSEVRATYGGFFIGISVYALHSQSMEAFYSVWLVRGSMCAEYYTSNRLLLF